MLCAYAARVHFPSRLLLTKDPVREASSTFQMPAHKLKQFRYCEVGCLSILHVACIGLCLSVKSDRRWIASDLGVSCRMLSVSLNVSQCAVDPSGTALILCNHDKTTSQVASCMMQ